MIKAMKEERRGLYIAVLFVFSLLLYSYTLGNGFVWDSEMVILEDPTIRDFSYVPSYFTEDTLRHTVEKSKGVYTLKYYRPFMKVFYLIEYKFFGTNPIGYHAVSVFLNALVVVICFLFVLEITGNAKVAFVSSIIYTVNPARAEVVNWVNSQSNILFALFCMLSLLCYHRKRYVLSLAGFGAALLIRETAILLPAILILYEFLVGGQKGLKGYAKILLFFAVAGMYLIIRQLVVGAPLITDAGIFTLFNTIAVILKRYVKIFFLPDAPVTIYPAEMFTALSSEVLVAYFFLAVMVLLGIFLWIKKRDHIFWYLWFFAWMVPGFNVGKFADYLMAEKGLYLTSLGFCVMIASVMESLRMKNLIKITLIVSIVFSHSWMTFSRSFYWKDTVTYLEKVSEFAPDMPLIHYSLGNAYSSRGRHDMAIARFKRAIKLKPAVSEAYHALGNEYAKKGQYELSLREFQNAVRMDPNNSWAYNNMGNVYIIMRDIDMAVSAFKKAIKSDPENPQPYYNIGMLMEQSGEIQSALSYYKKYLSLAPKPPPGVVGYINEFEAKTKKR